MTTNSAKRVLLARVLTSEPCLCSLCAVIQYWVIATATPCNWLATHDEYPNAVAAGRRFHVPEELRVGTAQAVKQDILVNRLEAEVVPLLPILHRSGERPVGYLTIIFSFQYAYLHVSYMINMFNCCCFMRSRSCWCRTGSVLLERAWISRAPPNVERIRTALAKNAQ